MKKKKILILNTGGTISCVKTSSGYSPLNNYIQSTLASIPFFSHPDLPEYVIQELQPLLDSSNMNIHEWNRIGQCIAKEDANYDGFVIFHGTDTMAYTASALSFMLENLNKPVIITGSQIPLSEVRNDAIDNIITSLLLCANHPILEVCIYFNTFLLRGNRACKISAQQFNAFDSPNYPPLADIGVTVEVHNHYLLPHSKRPFKLQLLQEAAITNLRLFPGMQLNVVKHLLQQPLHALILETYGAGNAPNCDQEFLDLLSAATQRGVIVLNTSQCPHGRVEMDCYATGSSLKQAGLISGYDLTPEAAYCKLLYLFSKYDNLETIKQELIKNICGEMSLS
jgi:L-asparaginase